MVDVLRLKVVTPLGSVLDAPATAVTAQSEAGEFCVLPQHRPILASLRGGRFVFSSKGNKDKVFVTGPGFFEGGPGHVNVVTQHCVPIDEVDKDAVQAELDSLNAKMDKISEDDLAGRVALTAAADWAQARLDTLDASK